MKQNSKMKRIDCLSLELDKSLADPKTGEIRLNLHFDAINNELKATLDHNNELIASTKQIQGYFGENKIRILSEIPKDPNDHTLDLHKKLIRYDSLLAIDTNSKIINEINFSVGFSCQLEYQLFEEQIQWTFQPVQFFVIIGINGKPENRNWGSLIEFIKAHPNYNSNHLIGIIVDSDLGEISDYNKGNKPIIDDFLLPNNFELIFASDKSSDNVLNAAIKHCHKKAKIFLDEFEKKQSYEQNL
jgi:hypothetical protein